MRNLRNSPPKGGLQAVTYKETIRAELEDHLSALEKNWAAWREGVVGFSKVARAAEAVLLGIQGNGAESHKDIEGIMIVVIQQKVSKMSYMQRSSGGGKRILVSSGQLGTPAHPSKRRHVFLPPFLFIVAHPPGHGCSQR